MPDVGFETLIYQSPGYRPTPLTECATTGPIITIIIVVILNNNKTNNNNNNNNNKLLAVLVSHCLFRLHPTNIQKIYLYIV